MNCLKSSFILLHEIFAIVHTVLVRVPLIKKLLAANRFELNKCLNKQAKLYQQLSTSDQSGSKVGQSICIV